MSPVDTVKIKVTVFEDAFAATKYVSYTLPNTPFYFSLDWNSNTYRTNYSQYRILWTFGDGTTYVGPSAAHFYKYPGVYNITATLFDIVGTTLTVVSSVDAAVTQITAVNAFPDQLVFQPFIPQEQGTYLLPAGNYSKPLDVARYNSWQNNDFLQKNNYTINLYASGCRSDFLSVSSYYTDKWSHLRNYFGFIEQEFKNSTVNTKLVQSTRTSSTSVFATKTRNKNSWDVKLDISTQQTPDSVFCGTSGTVTTDNKTVHFVDQRPGGPRASDIVFVYVSFDTSYFSDYYTTNQNVYEALSPSVYGYLNVSPQLQVLKSIFNPADKLAITSNGITAEGTIQTIGPLTAQLLHSFNIAPIKWANTDIPFVITFKDKNNYTTKCYPPITALNTSADEFNLKHVNVSLIAYSLPDPLQTFFQTTSTFKINEASIRQNELAPKYAASGSYFCGILNLPFEAKAVCLSAFALIQDEPAFNPGFNYGFAGQPGIKQINRFNKRSVFSNCEAPGVTFSIDGESNTYTALPSSTVAISVAPLKTYGTANYDKVWIADRDEDRIYVYSSSGQRLKTLTLSAMYVQLDTSLPPVLQNLTGYLSSASPANIAIDSEGYAWVTLYDTVKTIKIHPETYVVVASAYPAFLNSNYKNVLPASLSINGLSSVYITFGSDIFTFNLSGNSLAEYRYVNSNEDIEPDVFLYDSVLQTWVLKANSNGIIFAQYPGPSTNLNIPTSGYDVTDIIVSTDISYFLTDTYTTAYQLLCGFAGENTVLPSCVDTDTENNIWVSYSHPVCAMLMKYDSSGKTLQTILLNPFNSPQEIVVDKNNNVWVGAVNYLINVSDPYTRPDTIYKFDKDGNLIDGFPKYVDGFNNITIDLGQNVFTSNGYSKVTKFSSNGAVAEFTMGTQPESLAFIQNYPDSVYARRYYDASPVGGIATDAEGYLWLAHNHQGKMFFYDLTNTSVAANTAVYVDLDGVASIDLPFIATTIDGFQSFYSVLGDWTGVRWINKYYNVLNPVPRIIEGTSNLFDIYNNGPVINKINEDFDQAATFKSYVLQ